MITFLDEPERRLDAYLDDLLEGDELAAFERDLKRDPSLRASVALQHRIDAGLRRTLATPRLADALLPPAVMELLEGIDDAAPAPVNRPSPAIGSFRSPVLRNVAVAAALAAIVIAAWIIVATMQPGQALYQPPAWAPLEAVYRQKVDDGLKPDWVCENDGQFRRAFLGQYGQALQLDKTPDDIATVGLCYANTISTRTMMLLATVQDRPVIVFVDRLDHDKGQTIPPGTGLHLHRAVVGDLVLYELSPFGRPRLLEHLSDPDADCEGEGKPG